MIVIEVMIVISCLLFGYALFGPRLLAALDSKKVEEAIEDRKQRLELAQNKRSHAIRRAEKDAGMHEQGTGFELTQCNKQDCYECYPENFVTDNAGMIHKKTKRVLVGFNENGYGIYEGDDFIEIRNGYDHIVKVINTRSPWQQHPTEVVVKYNTQPTVLGTCGYCCETFPVDELVSHRFFVKICRPCNYIYAEDDHDEGF